MTWFHWLLLLALLGLGGLAQYYKNGRDDMASWCLYVSRKVWEEDKTAEEVLDGLKSIVIDKSEL